MRIIVVSDIFGRTPALESLCSSLPGIATIVDPYDGRFISFDSEAEAYSYFDKQIGLKAYTEKLNMVISGQSDLSLLIGFSVGASAVWLISCHDAYRHITAAICFYGSQIRHATQLSPQFPVHMILPVSEEHFSVPELSRILEKKENVKIHQSRFLHGFMNPHSKNYCQAAYKRYLKWLLNGPIDV